MEQYEMSPRKTMNRVGLTLALMAIVYIGSQILMYLLFYNLLPEFLETSWFDFTVTALSMVLFVLPVCFFVSKLVPDSVRGESHSLKPIQFIGYFFVCIAIMYLSNYIGIFVNFIISKIKGGEVFNPLVEGITNSNMIISIIYGVIIGPIGEELIFRKILLNKVRRLGEIPAILYTSIAFGLFHMNLSQFFYATTLGIVFAYLAIRTNKIRYSILLHIMINFLGTVVAQFVVLSEDFTILGIFSLLILSSIILGSILLIKNAKEITLERGAELVVEKKSVYILNFGTLLFLVICIYMMLQVILR